MDPKIEEAIHHERFVRIICIGAGASGLCLAYKLQRSFANVSLVLYEKNDGISGTWLENTYPGCACDIPAHNYTYSFEPKRDWSSVYASSDEIRGYFESFSRKHGLSRYVRTRSQVTRAEWRETEGIWQVEVEDLTLGVRYQDHCNILINASGYLNNWKWPDITGLDVFKGKLVHSAAWPRDTELAGKNVAIVGNGSSGVQILTAIQPTAAKVTAFIRSPNWILGSIGTDQHLFSDEEKLAFEEDPREHLRLRKYNETVTNSIFSVYIADSALQKWSKTALAEDMSKSLQTPELQQKLIPSWGVGCRRLTPGKGYLESLTKPNVEVVHGAIVALTEDGCVAEDGRTYQADVVICATGFNTSFVPRFPIIGSLGVNLQDAWSKAPSSLLGIATKSFPNYFMLLGPYSPVNNGPTIPAIEAQVDYILRLVSRYQTENVHSIGVNPVAERDFNSHVASFMQRSVWSDGCRSGPKNHSVADRVPTLWPGSTLHYLEAMREVRGDDWMIRYKGNRFAWLGNGISQAEFDPTCDLAYYLKTHDDSEPLGLGKRRAALIRSGSQPPRTLHRTYRPDVINL